mgnify:CR=1 FL=1
MKSDLEKWFEEEGEKILREIGIKKDDVILDFGCGKGIYSLPAAKIIGSKGKLFALDKSRTELNKLANKARSAGLNNIKIIETSGKLKIPMEDEFFDVVLLYDILHSYYFSSSERKELLEETYRVLKYDGFLSVYPEHMSLEEIKKEIEEAGFFFDKKIPGKLIHEEKFTHTHILNFKKTR